MSKSKKNEYVLKNPPAVREAPPENGVAIYAPSVLAESGIDVSKLKRRNLPLILKPDQIPVGQMISGEIIRIVPSPVSTIKGKLIWLKHENGTEYLLPLTGTIRTALAEDPEKEIGKLFVARRQPDGASKKFGGNRMFMFEVFTS